MATSRLFTLLAPSSSLFRNSRFLLQVPPPSLRQFNNPLRFNRYSSSSALTLDSSDISSSTVTTPDAVSPHPWPEWVNFINELKAKGYLTTKNDDLKEVPAAAVYGDIKLLKDACLSFGRDRFDIFRSMSTQDIQIVVENGCPNLLRKAVNSAKRLRAYLKLDEGDVCSSCVLRGSCDRAYIMLHDSEAAARTIDIVRILLFYALDPLVISGENKPLGRDVVELSARKLLLELIELGGTPPDPEIPRSAPIIAERKKQSRDLFDNERSQKVEMKPGDWLCTECDFMNFAKNTRCLKCKAERPGSVSAVRVERKKGDWDCPRCSVMNFASKKECFRCQEPRPQRQLKPGDWECPRCDFMNFSRNSTCKKCNNDRPDSGRQNDDQTWRKPY